MLSIACRAEHLVFCFNNEIDKSMNPEKFLVERSNKVTPAEIIALRETEGVAGDSEEIWSSCLNQSLCTVIVRSSLTRQLVGMGQVTGNLRHAQLTDLSVKREYRNKGIGKLIGAELLKYVEENQILYVGLTFDKNDPWLKAAYEQYGFRQIDFAMWLERSVKS